ncbi:MAG: hypothetical protein KDD94_14400 [Calditrichaeota bacterium]|nr:hypothetical protein [Calditrichota bacterium]
MKKLISQLKKEHELILSMMRDVKRLGIHTEAGAKKFIQTRYLLISHLNREDKQLYPPLFAQANNDRKLKLLLLELTAEIKNLTSRTLIFFDKYADISDIDEHFAAEAEKIFTDIKTRIEKEENSLYEEFKKLTTNRVSL